MVPQIIALMRPHGCPSAAPSHHGGGDACAAHSVVTRLVPGSSFFPSRMPEEIPMS